MDYEASFQQKFGTIVKRQSGQIYFACPRCTKKALSCNIQTGIYNCFACGFGKGQGKVDGTPCDVVLPSINSQLQIKILNDLIDRLTLTESHRDYLKKRGINNPEKYKLVSTNLEIFDMLIQSYSLNDLIDSGMLVNIDNSFKLANFLRYERIVIPYFHGKKIVGAKTRNGPNGLNEELTYLIPRSSTYSQYIYYHKILPGDLILTEAELKCIVGLENGLNVIGTSGINFSNKLMKQLNAFLPNPKIKRFFIAIDTELNNNKHYDNLNACLKLVSICREKSCIVTFPTGSKKGELDEFLIQNSVEDFHQLKETCWDNRSGIIKQYKDQWHQLKKKF